MILREIRGLRTVYLEVVHWHVERSVVTVLFDFQLASLQAELPLLEDLLFVGKKVTILLPLNKVAISTLVIVNKCDKVRWGQQTIYRP